jgi:membrane associated rhomboid family serine protease
VSPLGSVSLSFIVPSRMLFIMWLVFFIEMKFGLNLSMFGVLPRVPLGLIGILVGPLIHDSLLHLISNTLPLLFLGITLYFFYGKMARSVFLICYFIPGVIVWIFARPLFHLGASGLIYGVAAFLFVSGLVRKDFKSMAISIIIAIVYGGLVWGVLPTQYAISWEYHLAGAIVGGAVAILFRNKPIV